MAVNEDISFKKHIDLLSIAKHAAQSAYAPYSKFRVGAALLCEDGTIFTGVNVENRSYGLTVCAERAAIFTAVAQGKLFFTALAVSCIDADYPVPPCGACRQVISEFVPKDFIILFSGKGDVVKSVPLSDLLPHDALHELKDSS